MELNKIPMGAESIALNDINVHETNSNNELWILLLLFIVFMLIVFIISELNQDDEDVVEPYYS